MNFSSMSIGILALCLSKLLLSSFEKYNSLPINIGICLLGLVGAFLVGFNIGTAVGKSKR